MSYKFQLIYSFLSLTSLPFPSRWVVGGRWWNVSIQRKLLTRQTPWQRARVRESCLRPGHQVQRDRKKAQEQSVSFRSKVPMTLLPAVPPNLDHLSVQCGSGHP